MEKTVQQTTTAADNMFANVQHAYNKSQQLLASPSSEEQANSLPAPSSQRGQQRSSHGSGVRTFSSVDPLGDKRRHQFELNEGVETARLRCCGRHGWSGNNKQGRGW